MGEKRERQSSSGSLENNYKLVIYRHCRRTWKRIASGGINARLDYILVTSGACTVATSPAQCEASEGLRQTRKYRQSLAVIHKRCTLCVDGMDSKRQKHKSIIFLFFF